MFTVTDDPTKFDEALAWFLAKVPLTSEEYKLLSELAKIRAFSVAGINQLDIIFQVYQALEVAIDLGTGWEQFQSTVAEALDSAWGFDAEYTGYRIENIYRTNMQSAYSAGRYQQQSRPEMKKLRPFWEYDAILDNRTSQICSNLNGAIAPADDPFWDTHYPPSHFGGCRSVVNALTASQAKAKGSKPLPTQEADAAFRNKPSLDDYQVDLTKYPAELQKLAKERLGLG